VIRLHEFVTRCIAWPSSKVITIQCVLSTQLVLLYVYAELW
jgi:hypothetical protein